MKPEFIGYTTTNIYAIIWWYFDRNNPKPTYCFCEKDVQSNLERYRTPGDLYYHVPHYVEYLQKQTIPA
ncbi:MAG: hypothetical protein GX072_13040 [Lysinibacillus sp.]|nr:hypothetical protein [Lysinibacillus sp.]